MRKLVGLGAYRPVLKAWNRQELLNFNRKPFAVDDAIIIPYGTTLPTVVYVLENDYDLEGEELIIISCTQGNHGTVIIAPSPTRLGYQPNGGFSGNDSFTYIVQDEYGNTAAATVSVTVEEPPNVMPVATNDTVTTAYNTAVLIDVLVNDSDDDNDVLTIDSISVDPANGTAIIQDNKILYTPKDGYSGEDTLSYTITDGNGGNASATVNITVEFELGKALNFYGVNDKAVFPDADYANGVTKITMSFWAKREVNSKFYIGAFNASLEQFGLLILNNGDMYATARNGGDNVIALNGQDSSVKTHYVFSYDGSTGTLKLYANSILIGFDTTAPASLSTNLSGKFQLGMRYDNFTDTVGSIQELAIKHGYAATDQNVIDLYNNGSGALPSDVLGPVDGYYRFNEETNSINIINEGIASNSDGILQGYVVPPNIRT